MSAENNIPDHDRPSVHVMNNEAVKEKYPVERHNEELAKILHDILIPASIMAHNYLADSEDNFGNEVYGWPPENLENENANIIDEDGEGNQQSTTPRIEETSCEDATTSNGSSNLVANKPRAVFHTPIPVQPTESQDPHRLLPVKDLLQLEKDHGVVILGSISYLINPGSHAAHQFSQDNQGLLGSIVISMSDGRSEEMDLQTDLQTRVATRLGRPVILVKSEAELSPLLEGMKNSLLGGTSKKRSPSSSTLPLQGTQNKKKKVDWTNLVSCYCCSNESGTFQKKLMDRNKKFLIGEQPRQLALSAEAKEYYELGTAPGFQYINLPMAVSAADKMMDLARDHTPLDLCALKSVLQPGYIIIIFLKEDFLMNNSFKKISTVKQVSEQLREIFPECFFAEENIHIQGFIWKVVLSIWSLAKINREGVGGKFESFKPQTMKHLIVQAKKGSSSKVLSQAKALELLSEVCFPANGLKALWTSCAFKSTLDQFHQLENCIQEHKKHNKMETHLEKVSKVLKEALGLAAKRLDSNIPANPDIRAGMPGGEEPTKSDSISEPSNDMFTRQCEDEETKNIFMVRRPLQHSIQHQCALCHDIYICPTHISCLSNDTLKHILSYVPSHNSY